MSIILYFYLCLLFNWHFLKLFDCVSCLCLFQFFQRLICSHFLLNIFHNPSYRYFFLNLGLLSLIRAIISALIWLVWDCILNNFLLDLSVLNDSGLDFYVLKDWWLNLKLLRLVLYYVGIAAFALFDITQPCCCPFFKKVIHNCFRSSQPTTVSLNVVMFWSFGHKINDQKII